MTGPTPIVLVSGPPASGKTFVAEHLAEQLGIPLLAKDALKEVLYDSLGTGDVPWSERLGLASVALLYRLLEEQLRAGRSVVVEANFVAERARHALIRLGRQHSFAAFEVHCTARDEVLVARCAARAGSRHAGHLDEQRVDEIAAAIAARRNEALGLGDDVYVLDTTDLESVDLAKVVEAARLHLVGCRGGGTQPT